MLLPRPLKPDRQDQSRNSAKPSPTKDCINLATQESTGRGGCTARKGCRMKLVAATPTPGDTLRRIALWLKIHPKTRYLLLFAAICTICYLFMNDVAWASTEDRIS